MALQAYLQKVIRDGDLKVRLPSGEVIELGDGSGPPVAVRLTSNRWVVRLATNPSMALGEAYMEGGLVLETGGIWDLVDLIGRNAKYRPLKRAGPFARWWLDRRLQANARAAARRNVAHHYDLSVDFYRRFLDPDLQYSCAYFADPGMSLEQAQAAKKQHLAAKLLLKQGQKVLDIGCGWGGLGLSLARAAEVQVDGITLSTEQLATARWRAESSGLADRARFSLTDYRDVAGPYDRVISVGMFEHVGRPNYQTYFDQIARLLKDDGVAVVHSIGRADGPAFTQPWVAKYIFPGGYIPSLSEVLPCVERAGLIVADIEILRLHYAETLRCWRERFTAQRAEIAAMYDERFCRMWEFYLSISELAFRYRGHMVFQMQLAKRVDAAPITRDYMARNDPKVAEPVRQVA
ncbi:MAG TPA: cyclopropane-fatty-acyl-phospholipid synthase family protein [Phenylobacterium sp.]|jgi:cyclopropane-fatty-acyl-phospholipid synthase|uniref:cyclopropane-fatty-acyl-phospholipid synthase family protein n=1 Tax=Phenylobacterium sp. TaxID=1871053 RepID=UPI002D2DDFF6|nr:cyclopropane-fatty-acyl-phospholipid synthase family protein [Phenylobacterium sp.]HZZ67930.1 cyclopropane-fatty-acyl-phospholipid synthase family protein [Phenylobacterium sp.]